MYALTSFSPEVSLVFVSILAIRKVRLTKLPCMYCGTKSLRAWVVKVTEFAGNVAPLPVYCMRPANPY